MPTIRIIPQEEFDRVRSADADRDRRLALLADMCRLNTLNAVKRAGSGHLGSSFSAMDIVAWLYFEQMNVREVGVDSPDRDVYFSSKGHDVPGLYAVLHALRILPDEKLLALRRHGGLDGHPDVGVRGVEANSGSLGMGISKGRGIARAKALRGHGGRVYVMTGDGELQEGQIWESLQTTAHQGTDRLTVIVDHNKLQTDLPVERITSLGDLEAKLRAFGWHVERCDGHDFAALEAAYRACLAVEGRPQIIVADTIKGRGVSFMEHPRALEENGGVYRWHAGAPDDASFERAHEELAGRIDEALEALGLEPLAPREVPEEEKHALGGGTREYVAEAYGEALLELGERHPELVVLDGDLAADCRVRGFAERFPDRFVENGIAEQDMVSMAGGMARHGLLPVVNTFASFLAARANEQIYNNATEGSRILYACHYAGLIPAGPGKSHQSIRDASLFAALPNVAVLQPCNGEETRQAVRWWVEEADGSCALRLVIGPSPRAIELPKGYRLEVGRGAVLHGGDDALLFAYGPVMLHEALTAAEALAEDGFGLRVVAMPWLNRVDADWLETTVEPFDRVWVLEDHAPVGALADHLAAVLAERGGLEGRTLHRLAVEGFPACGTPPEALRAHGLDGGSIAARISGRAAPAGVADGAAYTAAAPQ